MTRLSHILLVVIGLGVGAPSRAIAQSRPEDQPFKSGKEAWDRKLHQVVIVEMQRAISANREDSTRRVGTLGPRYWPHFYLGDAYYQTGRCAEALTAWDIFSSRRGVAERDELRHIENASRECVKKEGVLLLAALNEQIGMTDDSLNESRSARRRLQEEIAKYPDDWTASGLQKELDAATQSLTKSEADAKLGRQSRKETDFESARRLAEGASSAFARIAEEFSKYRSARRVSELPPVKTPPVVVGPDPATLQKLVEQARTAIKAAETDLDALNRVLRDQPARANAADDAGGVVRRLRGLLNNAKTEMEKAIVEQNLSLLDTVTTTARSIRTQTAGVSARLTAIEGGVARVIPNSLQQGADVFFKGQYEEALGLLTIEMLQGLGPSLRSHAHAIRAAAAFAVYERSGRTQEALRAQAIADIDACKLLDPAFTPNPDAFSPRFIAFFNQPRPPGLP